MRLDPVHDLQKAFRKILSAAASPGEIVDLEAEARLIDLEIPVGKGLALVALTLLDAETTFHVWPKEPAARTRTISHMTYSRGAEPSEADYVLVADPSCAAAAIASAKAGTLVDPHLGATIVVQVATLSEKGGLALSGPGIESMKRLGIEPRPDWIAAREARNVEYPLGVDLVLVDEASRLAFLPRTTTIREEG